MGVFIGLISCLKPGFALPVGVTVVGGLKYWLNPHVHEIRGEYRSCGVV